MSLVGNEVDANFFNLIHRVIGEQQRQAERERRGDQRRCYQALARLALRRNRGVPDESEFVEVQCHDLTRSGCSFLLPYRPDFTQIVLSFGAPPEAIYLGAKVVRSSDVIVYPDGQTKLNDSPRNGEAAGTPMVLVGCDFSERLHRSRQ